ncbi:uncharacterized protein BP5553_07077 [Venustampulla echinocandica]|uniref:Core domain-containing protein n=1 Tax=Venustampulla echinocandica TaxID=2656787 RepID=A0A370TIG1_9HELO|nr:uncharacterized protein BP5553_07077 [Venustampulla echinocandica]RDL35146.1 hypothetical protein BP5553_07077 [Venustampulla echinocandica]
MATRSLTRSCSQLSSSHSPSAARHFLQLAPRRLFGSSAHPVLDFLLPPPSTTLYHGLANKTSLVRYPSQKYVSRRAFTSTALRRQTTAIFNPRDDDDGNPMNIQITPRAANRLKQIMSKDSNPNLALRIQVESGGCHGFQYNMSLTTLPPLGAASNPGSHKVEEEGSPALNTSSSNANAMSPGMAGVVQEESSPALNTSSTDANAMGSTSESGKEAVEVGKLDEDDTVFVAGDGSGAKVVMDGPSLELLKGSMVDFTMELIGSQFKIAENPLASSSCGCGTSFDIKA